MARSPASDARLSYWLKGQDRQNFGDFLSEFLAASLSPGRWGAPATQLGSREIDVLHLIGSVISAGHIRQGLEHARAGGVRPIAFWGCGVRSDAAIDPDLLDRCLIAGVRGPVSRDVLGLPPHTPLGDPALLLPMLHTPRPSPHQGKAVCVPHVLNTLSDQDLLVRTGAEAIVHPSIPPTFPALLALIDTIAGAGFVLAGALHAAIVACAYGVPFAFFDSLPLDVPIKWKDFAASVDVPPSFAKGVNHGIGIYAEQTRSSCRRPNMAPMLQCCPLRVRRSLRNTAERFAYPPMRAVGAELLSRYGPVSVPPVLWTAQVPTLLKRRPRPSAELAPPDTVRVLQHDTIGAAAFEDAGDHAACLLASLNGQPLPDGDWFVFKGHWTSADASPKATSLG